MSKLLIVLGIAVRSLAKTKKFAQIFIIEKCDACRCTGGSGVGGGRYMSEKVVSHYYCVI